MKGKSPGETVSTVRFIAKYNQIAGDYDWTVVSVDTDLSVTLITDGAAEDLSSFLDMLSTLPQNMRITNITDTVYTALKDVWNP